MIAAIYGSDEAMTNQEQREARFSRRTDMTYQDLIDQITEMVARHQKDSDTAATKHNQRVSRDKALATVRGMAPSRRLTPAEVKAYKRDALCQHDRDAVPMHAPDLAAELSLRHIAMGIYNASLPSRR